MVTPIKPRCALDWIPLELRQQIYGYYLANPDLKLALWIQEPTSTMINLEFDTRSAHASKVVKPGENIQKEMRKDLLPSYPTREPKKSTALHRAMAINPRLHKELLHYQVENSIFLLTAYDGLQAYPPAVLPSIRHLAIQTYPIELAAFKEIDSLTARLLELCPPVWKVAKSEHSFTLPNLQTITIGIHERHATAAGGMMDPIFARLVGDYISRHDLDTGTTLSEIWIPELHQYQAVGTTFAKALKKFLAYHISKEGSLLTKIYLQETANNFISWSGGISGDPSRDDRPIRRGIVGRPYEEEDGIHGLYFMAEAIGLAKVDRTPPEKIPEEPTEEEAEEAPE